MCSSSALTRGFRSIQLFKRLDDVRNAVEKVLVGSLTGCPFGVGEVDELEDLDLGECMEIGIVAVVGVSLAMSGPQVVEAFGVCPLTPLVSWLPMWPSAIPVE